MVVCNICQRNLKVEEMKSPFRYVCWNCWEKMKITIDGEELQKEFIY